MIEAADVYAGEENIQLEAHLFCEIMSKFNKMKPIIAKFMNEFLVWNQYIE